MKIAIVIAGLLLVPFALAQGQPISHAQSVLPAVTQPAPPANQSTSSWNSERIFVGGIYGINTSGSPHVGAFGPTVSMSHNFMKYLGVEAGYGRLFGHNDSVSTTTFVFTNSGFYGVNHDTPVIVRHSVWLAGPRANYRSYFFHVLFGLRRDTASAHNVPTTNDQGQTMVENISEHTNAFTMAIGGGNDWKISQHWAVRTSFDYVPSFKYGGTFRNVAASVGPVFSFGNRSVFNAIAPGPVVAKLSSLSSVSIPALGVSVAPREGNDGAEIVEVSPGSVAASAFLRVGDVINAVDDKPVKSARELLAELSNRAPGSQIRLGYLFRSSALGYFPKEINVSLGENH